MSGPTDSYEQYVVPEEFQERLDEIGGLNRFDKSNFVLRWAQGGQDECYYRAGGAWNVDGLPSYTGYRNLLIGGGTPSWMLMQWRPPEHYGTPEMWYIQGLDESTQLQTLGEYPYSGRYELLYNLRWMENTKDGLKFEAMPLNSYLLETVVPIIMAAKDVSYEKTKAALLDIKQREDARDTAMIEDCMRANALPFHGSPVSYGKQGCRTSLVDRKIEQMQRHWSQIMRRTSDLGGSKGRGLIQKS